MISVRIFSSPVVPAVVEPDSVEAVVVSFFDEQPANRESIMTSERVSAKNRFILVSSFISITAVNNCLTTVAIIILSYMQFVNLIIHIREILGIWHILGAKFLCIMQNFTADKPIFSACMLI